jgi:tetratricopeptide (TPR) repeat protein
VPCWEWQLVKICPGLLSNGIRLTLLPEVIAFCRELIKVAPASLIPDCYIYPAMALNSLQKVHEAEEVLHEGLVVGRQEGWRISKVSRTTQAVLPLCSLKISLPPPWRYQLLYTLAQITLERGEVEVAYDFSRKALASVMEEYAKDSKVADHFGACLAFEANILASLGRFDEAMEADDVWMLLNPGKKLPEALLRKAIRHTDAGEAVEAEQILRDLLTADPDSDKWHMLSSTQVVETALMPHIVLAELLERKGTEEALAEARTLRDGVAQQVAGNEARRAAALEETRAEAAEAARQWREERSKARGEGKGGKGKGKDKRKGEGKKKGRRGKAKGKGPSSAAAIEGGPPDEPVGGEAEKAAAAEAEQQVAVGDSEPPDDEEEVREECAVCLQDLEFEDDEDPWGDEGERGRPL